MSLRVKLFLTYALVVVVTILTAALGSAILLRQHANNLALNNLHDTARPISVQLGALVRGKTTLADVAATLQEQADSSGVFIFIADSSGTALRQFTPQGQNPIMLEPGTLPRDLTRAARGEIRTAARRVLLYAAYPLARAPEELAAARTLIIAIPQPRIASVLAGLLRPFLLAGFIALAASLLLALLLARSVSRPLNEVTAAADRIASGDYSYRIKSQEAGEAGRLARSFNHMAAEVEASHQRLRHFVADVSHELKSPLTAIQGFAQALRDGTAADETSRQNAARIIDEESRRLRRQVDELLQLSRLQSGQFKMNAGRLDLYAVLKQSAELFALPAADKHIEVKLSASPGLWVKGDADRLEQVFNNLLDNAVKNSPIDGLITVFARSIGKSVEVTVADRGPGLTTDQLSQVFERFYQVTGVRTGVGLGLAISREIVLAHGGSIEARSRPGEGAEFVIFLPAA